MRKRLMLIIVLGAPVSFAGPAVAVQAQVSPDVSAAVRACLTPAEQARPIANFSLRERQLKISCLNAHVARQMQSSLPLRVDDITTLTQLTTDGPRVIYHYRVARAAASLPADAGTRFESSTRAAVCSNPQMRQTISLGGSYEYRWSDNTGRQIHRMQVAKC